MKWSAVALALWTLPVHADGTLQGRSVTLNVETWDDPGHPLFQSQGRTVTVGPGVEFAMGPEGWTNGLDVVPVQVEIGPSHIEFSYGAQTGSFWAAAFNGYVLRFAGECALFSSLHLDKVATTLPLTDADLRLGPQAIYVNVAGRAFRHGDRIAVDVSVADCPLS